MKNGISSLIWLLMLFVLNAPALGQDDDAKPFADKMLPALFNEEVQTDLELVADQKSEMKRMLDELVQRKDQLGKELEEFRQQGATVDEVEKKRDEFVKGFEDDKAKTFQQVSNLLLPHQKNRLQQLTVQLMMREAMKAQRIPTGVLVPEMRKYLNIEDGQADRIKAKTKKLQEELAKKIKKLTDDARTELLKELTAEQKKKYDDLVGEQIN